MGAGIRRVLRLIDTGGAKIDMEDSSPGARYFIYVVPYLVLFDGFSASQGGV